MVLSYLAMTAYLLAAFFLTRYFSQSKTTHQHPKSVILLVGFALLAESINFSNFWIEAGIIFGLANSVAFVTWLLALFLFLSAFSKPVQALGILVYPLAAISLFLSILLPDTNDKIIPLSLASHVLLSITAYALLALAACQSILLNIQEKHLHERKINGFVDKLPALETMESLLFQNIRIGFYLLTLSLLTGFIFVDDFLSQHLLHKTVLSIIAWLIFASLIFGRKIVGWRGRQAIIATQIGFAVLLLAYFGSKFVLERLLN